MDNKNPSDSKNAPDRKTVAVDGANAPDRKAAAVDRDSAGKPVSPTPQLPDGPRAEPPKAPIAPAQGS